MQRRVLAAIGAAFVALMALFALAQPASADGEQVSGRIENRLEGKKTPIAGVTITAKGNGFEGSATSGPDGKWVIPLPAQGDYEVSIDVTTLPEGIGLTDPSKVTVKTVVAPPTINRIIIFPLGQSTAQTTSMWEQAAQLAVSGLEFGLLIALGALGLSLIYGTTGLTNFAHGELVTFGATRGLDAQRRHARPAGAGRHPRASSLSGAFGWLNNAGTLETAAQARHGPDRHDDRVASAWPSSCATSTCSSTAVTSAPTPSTPARPASSSGRCRSRRPTSSAMAITIVAARRSSCWLQRTRIGKATRAVSDNPASPRAPASTSTASSASSGSSARRSPASPASCWATPPRCHVGHGLPDPAADLRGGHARRPRHRVRRARRLARRRLLRGDLDALGSPPT